MAFIEDKMMPKESAGLMMYKIDKGILKVFLVHPGGPFWKNREEGAWSIPKGEIENKEDAFETAKREFKEEVGFEARGEFISLGEIQQKAGKIVHAWAFEGDWSGLLMCQSFVEIEWPLKSGKKIKIPEVDKARFFSVGDAKKRINQAQKELIERLEEFLSNKKSQYLPPK